MKQLKTIVLVLTILICAFLGLWIAQDNPQPVTLSLLGFPLGQLPLGLWLILALVCGLALGMLASLPLILKVRGENRRLRRGQ
jgi:uncharacterized integral membrane protein